MLAAVRNALAERGVGALLLTDVTDIGWLTGFSGTSARVLITETDAVFLTDGRYSEQAREEVRGMSVEIFVTPTKQSEATDALLAVRGVTRCAFQSERVSVAAAESLKKVHPGVEWLPVEDLTGPLRLVKSPEEIAKIRRACSLADAAFDHVRRLVMPGLSELEVALEIEFFFRRQGAGIAFPVIAVAGDRSARPHGVPSDYRLADGDFLTLDFGATLDGYHSDITRTVVVGRASDRHRDVYERVLAAQLAALAAMRPGVIAHDVDAIARETLGDLNVYFTHSLGHSLGRDVHDGGGMRSGSTTVLEPGQVWTIEPGVYIEGFGGVRIEDDVVVTESGIEIMTKSTKALLELPER